MYIVLLIVSLLHVYLVRDYFNSTANSTDQNNNIAPLVIVEW